MMGTRKCLGRYARVCGRPFFNSTAVCITKSIMYDRKSLHKNGKFESALGLAGKVERAAEGVK